MEENRISIRLSDNEGAGLATFISIKKGTTVAQWFEANKPGKTTDDYRVRLRRGAELLTPTSDDVFQEGDELRLTPRNIKGQ